MDEKEFNELVAKVGEEAAKKIASAMEEAKKGLITPDQLEETVKGLATDETVKELNKLVTDLSVEIDKMKQKAELKAIKKSLNAYLDEQMPAIEKLFKDKVQGKELRLEMKAAVTMTTANVVDNTAIDVDVIDSMRMNEGLAMIRRDYEYIFDIADRTVSNELPENIIWDEEGDTEGAFAIVAESGLKPLVSADIVRNMSVVQKVAGKIVVTEELLKFRQRIYNKILSLIRGKMARDYAGILTTNLLAAAVPYTGSALDNTFATPTDFDAIAAVAAQIEGLNFIPNVLVISSAKKWQLLTTKASDGHYYLNLPIIDSTGMTRLMGLRVVVSNKLGDEEAILGQGDLWKIEEEPITMRMGYGITMNGGTPEADFDYNRFRIILERFFHDYIASVDSGSYVSFNFATVKAALQTP